MAKPLILKLFFKESFMQIDLVYTLRLSSEQHLTENKQLPDDDWDAIYSVDFHMDDWDASTNVEHILNLEKYHEELAHVSLEVRNFVEDELREWLERRTLSNNLIVKDSCVVDVAFKVKPSGIKFRFIKPERGQSE
jgi:hypothetical protein